MPHTDAYRSVVDVHMILEREDGHVLLAQRAGTGYLDGHWGVPGGKLEPGENVLSAAIREAHEEIGVQVEPSHVECLTVVHHRNPAGEARIGFFFHARTWAGTPVNAEPDKCSAITWAAPNDLPEPMIGYSATGLRQLDERRGFTLDGWADSPVGA